MKNLVVGTFLLFIVFGGEYSGPRNLYKLGKGSIDFFSHVFEEIKTDTGRWPLQFNTNKDETPVNDTIPSDTLPEDDTEPTNPDTENEENSEEGEDRTVSFGELGLDQEQLKIVAKNIFNVSNAMTDIYSVSDGLTLTMYILRYMAEIGEFEIVYKDIMSLVRAFEKLQGEPINPKVIAVIEQIRKIKFGKKKGMYYARLYAKKRTTGIIIPINEKTDDPDSDIKEIEKVVVRSGAELYFDEVTTNEEKTIVRKFLKTPVKLLGVFRSIAKSLNQIHPKIVDNIDEYLELEEHPAPPMRIEMDGIKVVVDTTTVFKTIHFHFQEAYALPGIKEGEAPVPSFILGARAKLLGLKVSIDQ